MKIKFLLSLLLAGSLMASAQTQGYKDGIEYYKAGQYDNARTILERTINDSNTDKALANYYLGQVALAQGDKAAAKKYFDTGLAANPENGYNYVGFGALDLLNGDVKAAEDNFKSAQKLAKKDADVVVSIARAYYNADPVKYGNEVTKFIEKAHKMSKNKAPSIYILEGDILNDKGEYGQAAAKYEQAITFDPSNSEGYVKFANAYFYVNKELGMQKLEELLQKQPNSAMAQRELAEKYFKADHWKKASDLYGKYIQNPNHFPEDKARYAVLLYWGEKYPESLAIANEILAQNPNDLQSQRVRFLDQAALKDYAAAAENAKNFFENNKNNPDARFTSLDYITYAESLSNLGQDSLAIEQYEAAVKQFPENEDLLKTLSTAYSQIKQYAKSADAYGAYLALQENPSLNDLFGMSGRYLNAAAYATDENEAKELSERGISYLNQVIDRTSEVSPLMYQRLARLYVAGHRVNGVPRPNAEAIAAYDKMLEMLDKDPENMNPANANNALALYKEAYAFEQAYASSVGDKDGVTKWGEKYTEVNNLLNGAAN